jgi:hypothetical protein
MKVEFWLKKTKHNEFIDSIIEYIYKYEEKSMNLLTYMAYLDGTFISLTLLMAIFNLKFQEIISMEKNLSKLLLTKIIETEDNVNGIFVHEAIQKETMKLVSLLNKNVI